MWLSKVPEGTLTILVVVLASSGCFGLGILAGREMKDEGIQVEQLPLSKELPAASVQALSVAPEVPLALPAGGQYVGSKKGTKYHLPWCPGAKTMNEANKIWFESKEAAEAAGYTPAGNCKGI